jgi:hypothetical protein
MAISRRRILQSAAFAVSAPVFAGPPSIAALQAMRGRRHCESRFAIENRQRDARDRRLPYVEKPHELELMRIANQATLPVYEAIYKAPLAPAYGRIGFRGEASAEVGSSSSLPHGSAAARIIREG